MQSTKVNNEKMQKASKTAVTSIFVFFLSEIIPYIEYFQVLEKFGIEYSREVRLLILGGGIILRLLAVLGLMLAFVRMYRSFYTQSSTLAVIKNRQNNARIYKPKKQNIKPLSLEDESEEEEEDENEREEREEKKEKEEQVYEAEGISLDGESFEEEKPKKKKTPPKKTAKKKTTKKK